MFTGIVEEVGQVKNREPGRLVISASRVMDGLKKGGSIAINGACLSVTWCDDHSFSVDVVPETLRRTNLGSLDVGHPVNLERPVPVAGRLDGHIVQGHVDGTGSVESIEREGESLVVRFDSPPSLMRYIVEKGFIAVDGTSLTVVNCGGDFFTVAVIPHTLDNTILGSRRAGEVVNLEVDILAKYVERLVTSRRAAIDVADQL